MLNWYYISKLSQCHCVHHKYQTDWSGDRTRTYAVRYCMSRTFIQLSQSLDSDYAKCWTVQGSNPGRGNNFFSSQNVQTHSGAHLASYSKSTGCSPAGKAAGM
jgi:hypothetical protein